VKPTGVKSYIIQYRTLAGTSRRMTIGRHGVLTSEEARKEAKVQLGRAVKGDDPAADKARARHGLTFAAFTQRYLSDHAATKKKASSVRMDQLNLNKHILPILGGRRLDAIGRNDVVRLHHSMRNTPGAANRCIALLSKMMNLAERWGKGQTAPIRAVMSKNTARTSEIAFYPQMNWLDLVPRANIVNKTEC
jgi:hypothetical protein